ncbi:MAG: glycosyltransferase family 4 protein [Candidatus Cloacimonadaceae bacterium]|nr:glycosyltransferase family 4 protein [Candidatus Cloacimonadaceae bacterium]
MKILCISNFYPPYFEGGYEISIQQSMDYLVEHGHKVFVLCGNRGVQIHSDIPLGFTNDRIQRLYHYIDYSHASFLNKHQVEKHNYHLTLTAIKLLKPDLIYFGSLKAISIAPALAVQNQRIPRIYDIGDDWLRSYLGTGLKSTLFRFLKRILPFTIGGNVILDPVLVPSRWMADELQSRYHSQSIHIIPRAVALPPFQRTIVQPLRFVFAGRIEPLKGLDILVEAIRLLKPKYPEFSVDLYGSEDPDYVIALKAKISSFDLQPRFHFKGKCQDMNAMLSSYDVLLMPTMARETFGRVIIEAMAAGLIVIATNAYGPAEIISDRVDSLLFERADPVALAACIEELLSAPIEHIRKLGNAARAKVASQYEISLVKKGIGIILDSEVQKQRTLRGKA